MTKERPCDLKKKLQHLRKSRDNLKLRNYEKTQTNKAIRDRNVELAENRDHWKAHSKELTRQKENLEQQVQAAREETERERIRADRERWRADQLQSEIEILRGKKSRA